MDWCSMCTGNKAPAVRANDATRGHEREVNVAALVRAKEDKRAAWISSTPLEIRRACTTLSSLRSPAHTNEAAETWPQNPQKGEHPVA